MWRSLRLLAAAVTGVALLAGPVTALATPGDTYRVTAERANLRAGPSDNTNVRGQIEKGEQLLELQREGDWYGVRVMRTGEEGWIFGDLIERTAQSTLGAPQLPTSAGFLEFSENFDQALRGIDSTLGYPIARSVKQGQNGILRVTANPDWLRATSRDAHLMAALAVYEMWKNHQNNGPVQVILLDGDRPYITIADETNGPRVTVAGLGNG